jgi:hypothetical protein
MQICKKAFIRLAADSLDPPWATSRSATSRFFSADNYKFNLNK